MLVRLFRATALTALLTGSCSASAQADSDSFFTDLDRPVTQSAALHPPVAVAPVSVEESRSEWSLGAANPQTGPITSADLEGWAPEHALGMTGNQGTGGAAAGKPSPKGEDRSLDPEPDQAVKSTPHQPVGDPLEQKALDTAQPSEPLPPLNAAVKAVLDKRGSAEIRGPNASERRKEREAIEFFYAAHGFSPAWSESGAPVTAVEPVLSRLARAGDDALALAPLPSGLKTRGSLVEIAESDVALTEAVVAYARQATGSRVDPRSISPLIGAKPELADPAEVLDMVAAAGPEAGDKLRGLNPSDPRYIALRGKLEEMHAARTVDTKPIPPGPLLRSGMRDPRVPLIRSRFSLDVTLDDDDDSLRYDTQVAAAVADFQRANGLPISGDLTKRTIAALSGGQPSRLEGALVANMEMWRWMPRDLGQDRIEVNVPDFLATVYRGGQPVATNRVVVGKTDTPTPLFSNKMQYLIVNPIWNVPDSIIKKEYLPKGGGDLSYLSRRGYSVSWKSGRYVVKQLSGEKNALGRIKFIFPNEYSVYLHDTPSKSLFAASKRAFSHGCVRVDQPFEFAQTVLNKDASEGAKLRWSEKRLKSLLGDKERYINLPEPLPIHIEYFTAKVDSETGRLQLREDVYDYVRRVALALGHEG